MNNRCAPVPGTRLPSGDCLVFVSGYPCCQARVAAWAGLPRGWVSSFWSPGSFFPLFFHKQRPCPFQLETTADVVFVAFPGWPKPIFKLLGDPCSFWLRSVSVIRVNLLRCVFQVCDEPEELKRKVSELAAAVRSARHLVIYTGAGISTVRWGSSWSPAGALLGGALPE